MYIIFNVRNQRSCLLFFLYEIFYIAGSSPTVSETIALQVIYYNEFKKDNYKFLKDNIDFSVSLWMKDLLDFISDECKNCLIRAWNNAEKVESVANFLIQRNDITTYKKFIAVWKKYGGAKARQFELKLQTMIETSGLTLIDNQFLLNG